VAALKVPGERRSITTSPIPTSYVGDDTIRWLYHLAREKDEEISLQRGIDCDQHRLYFTSLWVTGGRIGEVVLLRPEQVVWNKEALAIYSMRVFKRRKPVVRRVLISRRRCPLAENFIEFVEKYRDMGSVYLLPIRQRFTSEPILDRHTSSQNVYNYITNIHPTIWPHWIRDQRAYFLRDVLGFSIYELRKWFEWATIAMPAHYIKPGEAEMLRKQGVSSIPEIVLEG